METPKISTLDEKQRILLSSELQTLLGWEKGVRATARINEESKSIEIIPAEDGEVMVDELNRITIDKELCNKLGWGAGKKSVMVDITSSIIKITSLEKQ